jgi:cation:H+ antiporter
MMMLESIGFLALGLVLVMFGADAFLKGVSGLAQGRGVGGFAAGLSMVAVGASVAEVAIATAAILTGHDALALGTVVGSCIANLGLIVGVSALVKPLSTGFRLIGVALPILIGAVLALLLMGSDGSLQKLDGAVLLLSAAAFGWLVLRAASRETEAVRKELAYAANTQTETTRNIVRIALGIAMLGYGAWRAVTATVVIGAHFGMSELWMGLTVLAVGAALPELASAIVAAARGHGNVVVGSAAASSVVSLLLVLGLLALWRPVAMPGSLLKVELPALLAFALAFYPMIRGDAVVSRREGLILVLAFAGWIAWLLLPRFS